jgi:hypothetical protein
MGRDRAGVSVIVSMLDVSAAMNRRTTNAGAGGPRPCGEGDRASGKRAEARTTNRATLERCGPAFVPGRQWNGRWLGAGAGGPRPCGEGDRASGKRAEARTTNGATLERGGPAWVPGRQWNGRWFGGGLADPDRAGRPSARVENGLKPALQAFFAVFRGHPTPARSGGGVEALDEAGVLAHPGFEDAADAL